MPVNWSRDFNPVARFMTEVPTSKCSPYTKSKKVKTIKRIT